MDTECIVRIQEMYTVSAVINIQSINLDKIRTTTNFKQSNNIRHYKTCWLRFTVTFRVD